MQIDLNATAWSLDPGLTKGGGKEGISGKGEAKISMKTRANASPRILVEKV